MDETRDDRGAGSDDRGAGSDDRGAVDIEAALAEVAQELIELEAQLAIDPQLPDAPARLVASHHRRAELLLAAGPPRDAVGAPPRDAVGALPRDAVGALPRDAVGALPRDAVGALPRDAVGALPRDAVGALLLAARAVAPLDPSSEEVGQRLPRLSCQLREAWRESDDPVLAARLRRAAGVVDDVLRVAVEHLGVTSIGFSDHPLVDVVTAWCEAPAFDGVVAAQELADAAAGRDVAGAELRVGRREQALTTASTVADRAVDDGVDTVVQVEVLLELSGVALEAEDHRTARDAAETALGLLAAVDPADAVAVGRSPEVAPDRVLDVVGRTRLARAHHLAGCARVYGEDPEGALAHLERAHDVAIAVVDRPRADHDPGRDVGSDAGIAGLDATLLACDVVADLAFTRRRLGDRHGDANLAVAGLDRALSMVRAVGPGWSPGVQRAVGRALTSVALAQPRPELAPGPELVALAVRVLDHGCHHDPDDGYLHAIRAQLLHLLSMLRVPSDPDAAADAHARATDAFDELARLEPGSAWTLGTRAELLTIAAALDLRAGRNGSAGRRLREVVDVRRRVAGMRPGSPWALKRVAVAHRELARTAARLNSRRVAVGAIEAMVAAAERRVDQAAVEPAAADPGVVGRGTESLTAQDPSAVADLDELLDEAVRLGIAVGDERVTQRVVAQLVALRSGRAADVVPDDPVEGARVDPAGPDRLHELVLALLLAARTGTEVDQGPAIDRALILLEHLDAIDPTHPRALATRVEAHHVAANLARRSDDEVAATCHAREALAVPGVLDPSSAAGSARIDQLRELAAGPH